MLIGPLETLRILRKDRILIAASTMMNPPTTYDATRCRVKTASPTSSRMMATRMFEKLTIAFIASPPLLLSFTPQLVPGQGLRSDRCARRLGGPAPAHL